MLSDVLPLFENMGVRGRRRAPLPDHPARPRRRLDLRLRAHLLRRRATSTRRRPRELPGHVRARVARRRGERRLQPARAAAPRSPGARSRCCARSASTCARRGITFSDSYVEQALVAHPEIARLLVALFQARFDPRRTDREDAERGRRADRARRSTPSRASTRTDPAHVPRRDPARSCARTTSRPAADRGGRATCRSSSTRRELPLAARSRARASRSSSTRRAREGVHLRGGQRRARRHPLVGPARGLPHRGARPDEGADGEERRDRAGRARRAASS